MLEQEISTLRACLQRGAEDKYQSLVQLEPILHSVRNIDLVVTIVNTLKNDPEKRSNANWLSKHMRHFFFLLTLCASHRAPSSWCRFFFRKLFYAHLDVVHDGGEFVVLLVHRVDRLYGVIKVLDILGVHLEEWRELDDDVADAAVALGGDVPLGHALAQLRAEEIKK